MGASDADALIDEARSWLADDPDPRTRDALQALIDADDRKALCACMRPPLRFGTAGLRGLLGPGPACMNRAVVARATAGMCAHLLSDLPDAAARGLCIGFDARHGSLEMARQAAAVALGAGMRVRLFETPGPTPLLAYAVLEHGAAGGAMVTASHNPAAYNGFKVYGPDGGQIAAPMDAAIAARIEACGAAGELPQVALDTARADGRLEMLGEGLTAAYLADLKETCPHADADADADTGDGTGIAYTALHGVGEALARRALAEAGFGSVHSVQAQAQPDPDFPTVAFPNPEEPGAMDAVLALAESEGLALALANDPDADRLAVAARDRCGALRMLDGNQVGVLLGDYLLSLSPTDGRSFVVTTVVSTAMLARVAAARGAGCETTLIGFKWILQRAAERQAAGGRFVLGFEEALGYAAGQHVRDKDGVMAAVMVSGLARACAAQGQTLWDRLDALYTAHGHHRTAQHSARFEGPDGVAKIAAAVQRWRDTPPATLAGQAVTAFTDLQGGERRTAAGREPATLPKTNALLIELHGGHRVCVRPSGTEPKLKVYFETVAPPMDDLDAARAQTAAVLSALRSETLRGLGLD